MSRMKLILARLALWWCDLAHGGGRVTRDPLGRINWQCGKCGRWGDPVPLDVERRVVDGDIRREMKP